MLGPQRNNLIWVILIKSKKLKKERENLDIKMRNDIGIAFLLVATLYHKLFTIYTICHIDGMTENCQDLEWPLNTYS